jgi:hypothetical protein
VASLACFADPYALVFMPGVICFALLCAVDGGAAWRLRALRVGVAIFGALVGAIPLLLLWHMPAAKRGPTGLTAGVLEHNYRLLAETCLPWGLSYQAWTEEAGRWTPWVAPPPVRVVQIVGACILVGGIFIGLFAVSMRGVAWEVRRLGVAGAVTCAATVAGFLSSVMVMDHFSTRYLAAIVLASPFALAPLVALLHARRAAMLLAPYLASAGLSGWLGLSPWTEGARMVATPDGTAKDERALGRELEARGVRAAMADYWVSYRLTFLFEERIVVIPKNAVEDRYAPYVRAFERAPIVAYVFDPDRSREDYTSIPEQLRERDVTVASAEWLRAGRLTASFFIPMRVCAPTAKKDSS